MSSDRRVRYDAAARDLPTLASPRRAVVIFILVVLVLGWSRLLPPLIEQTTGSPPPAAIDQLVLVLASFAPLWAALLVASRRRGGPGAGVVLRQLLHWRVGLGWYIAALIGPVILAFAALGIALVLGVPAPGFGMAALTDAATIVVVAVTFAIAEELGWRGYLQASLQRHASALAAALVVAVVAVLWHFPLFFTPEHVQSRIPPLALIAWLSGITVVLAAMYNSTRGSIPVVVVAHVALNASVGSIAEHRLVDGASVAAYMWVAAVLMWLVAALIVLRAGSRTLSMARAPS